MPLAVGDKSFDGVADSCVIVVPPLLFCALTTMVALLSFWLVPMLPIRWVGLTAAALVGATYVLVIIMLPTLLSFGKD